MEKKKWIIRVNYFGKDPPCQYPTAIEFKSSPLLVLLILLDLRYLIVLLIQVELDDVYLITGYMYTTPAINNVQ